MEIPETFEAEWVAAARYGLKRAGYQHWCCVGISMPFYGRVWRPDEGTTPPVFDDGLGERRVAAFGLPDFGRAIESAAEWLDRHTGGSGRVLDWLLADTRDYMDRSDLRDATDGIVRDACVRETEPILVGFSMGALVAYNVLAHESAAFPVKSLITCGSPMGDPAFRDRLERIGPRGGLLFPPCLRMWANIWNDDDPATQNHDLTRYFRGKYEVQSQPTRGRGPGVLNPAAAHNGPDYLSSIALGSALKAALEAAERPQG